MNRALVPKLISVSVTTPGTAVRVSSVVVRAARIDLYADNGNSDSTYLGDSSVDNTWIPYSPGDKLTLVADEISGEDGDYFDLSKLYVDADTASNKLLIQYWS